MAQQKWLVDSPKTIDIDSARTLKVGLIGGQIDVVAHDEPGVRIEIHAVSGKELRVSTDGDTVEIDHPQLGRGNWLDIFKFTGRARAEISVMVPRDIRLKLGVVDAEVLVSGIHQDMTLSSVNGDLTVDEVTGELQLNTVTGEVNVRQHTGGVASHSVSGSVTAAGALRTFRGDSVAGSTFLDVVGIPDEIKVNTVSGSATVRLEADVPASYTINTVGGRLTLDSSRISGVHGQYTGRFGELDGRWLDLRINTVGGDVSVLHGSRPDADAAAAPAEASA